MTAPASARRVVRYETVESTQPIAFDLAGHGAADGTVVVADAQTTGRGRRGRKWHAEPGTSLLVSIILRPDLDIPRLPLLSFAAALAVAETVERVGGVTPGLKWPNDVLVRGRKIAGILLESRVAASGSSDARVGSRLAAARTVVVIGVGLNLGQSTFPMALADHATSLLIETDRLVDREPTLTVLLDRLDHWRAILERDGFAPLRARWLDLAETIGRTVTIDGVSGVAVDLAPDGALLVDDGGTVRAVTAGDVRQRAEEPVDAARR